jgi:hypothetical protein
VGHLNYDIQLHGFIDLDWVWSAYDRRSATWICFILIFAIISWDRRKQKSVSLNTTEAEYIATCDASTKSLWLSKLVYRSSDQVLN